jgi:hypothetical protein
MVFYLCSFPESGVPALTSPGIQANRNTVYGKRDRLLMGFHPEAWRSPCVIGPGFSGPSRLLAKPEAKTDIYILS